MMSSVNNRRTRRQIGVGASVGLILAAALSVTAIAGSWATTRGPIPDKAFEADGHINRSLVPDYVPVAGPDGTIVGYVTKEAALDPPLLNREAVDQVPVFGDDLKTLVGHLVDGRGFVTVGSSTELAPLIPVEHVEN